MHHGARRVRRIAEPSLLFYPRVQPHRFVTDAEVGADMACANVAFVSGASSPIAQALPAFTVLPLAALGDAQRVLDLLFEEAFARRCGRQHVVDRLFEVVLIHVLRTLMDSGRVDGGLLAGMAHPKLARALVAMHEAPGDAWTLDSLARRAGMSRSHFAATLPRTRRCHAGRLSRTLSDRRRARPPATRPAVENHRGRRRLREPGGVVARVQRGVRDVAARMARAGRRLRVFIPAATTR